jgi:radical SAM superfamily enzyme YgiQ (UPF0313 family)
MKIGFIVCVDNEIEKNQMFGISYMPVWAFTLAAYLREFPDLEIFLYDTRFNDKSKTPYADVYLISGINQDLSSLLEYNKLLKNLYPDSRQIIGGPITLSYNLINKLEELKVFDHIFIGDGENSIKNLISSIINKTDLPKTIKNNNKFMLNQAIPMDLELLSAHKNNYYGGVLEVSRGCPFLCEFCDIRTKPDNNQANNKSIEVILKELDQFLSLDIKDILFACDNFIGDHVWAEELCDKIIQWKQITGYEPHFYTWLTINLVYHPRLMEKMKLAGFDMFFIGIESFGKNQLLETAKLQNVKTDMSESIRGIQGHGFIVVAGLIFGFDSDPEDAVQVALDGIRESGLISGDPSLLTALPGTPLHRRIEKSGRLRESKIGLGGKKYVTNILYLRERETMINDFIHFVHAFNKPSYQLARFTNFINCLKTVSPAQTKSTGYINIKKLWGMVSGNPKAIFSIAHRVFGVCNTPSKIYHIAKAFILTKNTPNAKMTHFYFWVFNWSNSILKYGDLKRADFDIDSVPRSYELKNIIPVDYDVDFFEPIPASKIKAQRQATIRALKKIISYAE